jgi:hypothetical protein
MLMKCTPDRTTKARLMIRPLAASFALILAAGCSGSGPSAAPPPVQAQSGSLYPADSPAARHILANVGTAPAGRAPQRWYGHDDEHEDDGGEGELQLPAIVPCGNGTFATDCSVWSYGNGGTRSVGRRTESIAIGTPPALNFCRDAALFPPELAPPAIRPFPLGTYAFSLRYLGTKAPPIVTFATRWWNVNVTGTFAGTSTYAPAIAVSPNLTNGASRGWLIFFTWSWPTDILLIPNAINEIQLSRASSPLAIPAHGTATLGAFDCLGQTIHADRAGHDFGFSPDLNAPTFTSTNSELNTAVFGGANPSGFIFLSDNLGARTVDPVVPAAPAPSPTPTPSPAPGR